MSALAEGWYDGLRRGELLIQTCTSCGKDNMYPRYRCPYCYEASLDWRPSTGRGVLMSFMVQRGGAPTGFEDEVPYALGVVRLDEDVQVLGRLAPDAGGDWDAYVVDGMVELCEGPSCPEGRPPAPWFSLPDEATG